jgi:precorrin-2 dehydrogenase/sirohydrochlorin ferrochelatase
MNRYYPMFVNLSKKQCLIIGGGKVAERKIASLLETAAVITVVSPTFTPCIQAWIDKGFIHGRCRIYEQNDGADVFIVIAASDSEEVNRLAAEHAKARGQWVNTVDQPELSSFINPSTMVRGKLQISVSTSGSSPGLARKISKDLEALYGVEYEVYLDFLSEYRLKMKDCVQDVKRRRRMFQEMVEAETEIIELIRRGTFEMFRNQAIEKLGG